MCGRYALALRPSQVRQMLQDDDMQVVDAPMDEGDDAPRQSYNFAPGYHGIVYRADVPDWGVGPRREVTSRTRSRKTRRGSKDATNHHDDGGDDEIEAVAGQTEQKQQKTAVGANETRYKLQSMKWGLIPFWTKRNPDYAAIMKTINCRDDSLAQMGGMWSSMKGRKRCVVIAQGFYEWLKSGKEKVPHFVKRKDGKLMCFAGLWDCTQYEDTQEKNYTYTIITTDSNKQLKFLHDRMPVIFDPASEQIKTWLDPGRHEWSNDLQDILKPFDGDLEVYPVSKEVGKVGNNSPTFIVPVASRENKSNIANFFANAQAKPKKGLPNMDVEVKRGAVPPFAATEAVITNETVKDANDGGMSMAPATGLKRKADHGDVLEEAHPMKRAAIPSSSPGKAKAISVPNKSAGRTAKTISSTSNSSKSPAKGKSSGTPKITKFFGNSA